MASETPILPKLQLYRTMLLILLVIVSGKSEFLQKRVPCPKSFDLKEDNVSQIEHQRHRFAVAHLDWEHVKEPFIIALWILAACVAKIGFNMSKRFSSIFPDSSLLIIMGLIIGVILFFLDKHCNCCANSAYQLDAHIFFLILLPPIVLDAGWFMPTRAFFDNIATILVYAVFGTIFNAAGIGLSLWALGKAGIYSLPTPLLHVLLFASLIAAVDPVAVLVVFEEIHVNKILFISVFGESLLNDGVAVVLYSVFSSFSNIGADNLKPVDFVLGLLSFFVIALGGVAIGLIWALLVSLLTRWTKKVRVLEPLYILMFAYCSYLTAELFHLSGILAIVTCGITMKQYVVQNVAKQSVTAVNYFLKMLSTSSETIIFMFLGLSTVTNSHHWDFAFVGLTLLFCLVYRALGVILQTYFINKHRIHKFSMVDQFIMAYGGLRGAIAYGLVSQLEDTIDARKMYITSTIVVIYFTVFLQGMTIKPLVTFLKVKKDDEHEKTMCEQIIERTSDHAVSCMEVIAGYNGQNALRSRWNRFNSEYLMPILQSKPALKGTDNELVTAYTEIKIREAENDLQKYGTIHGHRHYPINSSASDSRLLNSKTKSGYHENIAFVLETDSEKDLELGLTKKKSASVENLESPSKIHNIPLMKFLSHTPSGLIPLPLGFPMHKASEANSAPLRKKSEAPAIVFNRTLSKNSERIDLRKMEEGNKEKDDDDVFSIWL